MQAKNVSELEDVSTLSDTDSILIGQSNTVKKTTFANIKSVFQALIGVVTSTVNGLMSYTDKNNLDALQTNFGGKSVVDSVTDGNLNPVTSNAVNDTLTNYIKVADVSLGMIAFGQDIYQNLTFDFSSYGVTKLLSVDVCMADSDRQFTYHMYELSNTTASIRIKCSQSGNTGIFARIAYV